MGNAKSSLLSSSTVHPLKHDSDQMQSSLAMMAVASKISLHRAYILALRHAMSDFSDDFGMIKRQGFNKALASVDLSGVEVLDLLFTMWDNADDDKVSSKEFCMGISPLACPFNDLSSIIEFALRISDDSNRQHINRRDLHKLLTGKPFI